MGRRYGFNPCACWALKDACIVVGIWTFIYGLVNLGLFGWQTMIVQVEKERAASQRALWYGTLRRDDPRYPASYEQFYQTPEERFFLGLYIVQIIHIISDIFLMLSGILIIWATISERRFLLWPYFPAIIVSILCSAAFCGVWFSAPKAPSTPAKLATLKSIRDRIPYWPVMVAFELLMFLVNIYCFIIIIAGYLNISRDTLKLTGYYLERKPIKGKAHKSKSNSIALINSDNKGVSSEKETVNLAFHDSEPGTIRKPLDPNLLPAELPPIGVPSDPYPPAYDPRSQVQINPNIPHASFTDQWLHNVQPGYPPHTIPPPDLRNFIPPPPSESGIRSNSRGRRRKKRARTRSRRSSRYTDSIYRKDYPSVDSNTDSTSCTETDSIDSRRNDSNFSRPAKRRASRNRKSRSCYYDRESSSDDNSENSDIFSRTTQYTSQASNSSLRSSKRRYRSDDRLSQRRRRHRRSGPGNQKTRVGHEAGQSVPEDPAGGYIHPEVPSPPVAAAPQPQTPTDIHGPPQGSTTATITIPQHITIPAASSPPSSTTGTDLKQPRKPKEYQINSEIVIKMPRRPPPTAIVGAGLDLNEPPVTYNGSPDSYPNLNPTPVSGAESQRFYEDNNPIYQTVAEAEEIRSRSTVV